MTKKLTLKKDTLQDIMQHYSSPEQFAEFFAGLKKAVIEQALAGELDVHLGYAKNQRTIDNNSRNGVNSKRIITDTGELVIDAPRDRDGSFTPQIIKKGQTRLRGFDDKIIAMYARGMSMRQIQEHLLEIYGTEVSPELICTVTDRVYS
jgi:putative transposase